MKRDMDLVRALLLRIEEFAQPITTLRLDYLTARDPKLAVEGHDSLLIAHHVSLLLDAGLITGSRHPVDQSNIIISGLTWHGHDFIDSVRDPEIWRATKDGAKQAGGFTLELLGDLAKGLIKTQIEKHTGVKL